MPKHTLLIARFPYGASEHPAGTDWLVKTVLEAKAHAAIDTVLHAVIDDTPITMSRNRACKQALDHGADYLLMLDSDMAPDLPYPGCRPFFLTALNFMLEQGRPCVVGAPYCGPPPCENVYVFRWGKRQNDHPNVDLALEQFTREEATVRAGFEEVGALPTGLILIDTRALRRLPPPWFEYEWADAPFNTRKASTEDVYFTRNLSLAGVPQYVLWDAWAGHVKRKIVGRPTLLTVDAVREEMREAVLKNRKADERLVQVGAEEGPPTFQGLLHYAGKYGVPLNGHATKTFNPALDD